MQSVNLFDLASTQARWLSARQTAIASNIANANTVGYTASDVEPFEKLLGGNSRIALATTEPSHFAMNAALTVGEKDAGAPKILPSGNTVKLEDEFVKAGEVRREFEVNTAIVKAFHRMLLSVAKS